MKIDFKKEYLFRVRTLRLLLLLAVLVVFVYAWEYRCTLDTIGGTCSGACSMRKVPIGEKEGGKLLYGDMCVPRYR
jgi:hypothetical protein